MDRLYYKGTLCRPHSLSGSKFALQIRALQDSSSLNLTCDRLATLFIVSPSGVVFFRIPDGDLFIPPGVAFLPSLSDGERGCRGDGVRVRSLSGVVRIMGGPATSPSGPAGDSKAGEDLGPGCSGGRGEFCLTRPRALVDGEAEGKGEGVPSELVMTPPLSRLP